MAQMITHELDPDVVRWGLHHLDVCCLANGGSPRAITRYDKDLSSLEYVREGYCEMEHINLENDEAIANALPDELSWLAFSEPSGPSYNGEGNQLGSIFSNDQLGPLNRHGHQTSQQDEGEWGIYSSSSCPREKSFYGEAISCTPGIADEFILDGELGKRLNQMIHVPHVPKVNGEIPSVDEETSDHQRLMDRLLVYDLVELKVSGDGNCQFRSLSDQIYHTTEHHKFVREQIVNQFKLHPELYEGYVPMVFYDYVKKMRKVGEWGDHVTLQAASDVYGVKIFIITSFKDTCYIEILPNVQKSKRSFEAQLSWFSGDQEKQVVEAAGWELAALGGECSEADGGICHELC
ncbi:hypothetical protein LguiA_016783 [Lonicera macranthoides]